MLIAAMRMITTHFKYSRWLVLNRSFSFASRSAIASNLSVNIPPVGLLKIASHRALTLWAKAWFMANFVIWILFPGGWWSHFKCKLGIRVYGRSWSSQSAPYPQTDFYFQKLAMSLRKCCSCCRSMPHITTVPYSNRKLGVCGLACWSRSRWFSQGLNSGSVNLTFPRFLNSYMQLRHLNLLVSSFAGVFFSSLSMALSDKSEFVLRRRRPRGVRWPNSTNLPINLHNHLALLVTREYHVTDAENTSGLICSRMN